MAKLEPTEDLRCGSVAGHLAHRTRGEKPCEGCRKAINAYQALSYEKNLKKRENYRKAYYLANKEKINAKNKEWRKKHNLKVIEYSRRKRARLRGNHAHPYTEKQVLELYGTSCHICGYAIDLKAPRQAQLSPFGLHIDHVIPISKNGSDSLENVRPAHAVCNLRKGNK